MKKTRLMALVICLALVLTALPSVGFAEEPGPDAGTVVESYDSYIGTQFGYWGGKKDG